MTWEVVIGLEVHIELSTKSKIFCGCDSGFGGEPNSHTCPGCMGLPGTLPVLNKAVIDKAITAGLALGCTINKYSVFDRKHYFYPDLTKNYQISQFYHHLCSGGMVEIETANGAKTIRLNRIHIEEDAGKLLHEAGYSLVDGNRGGMALIEIVSEPDMRGADEAEAYLSALRERLVYTEVSDCRMQEGSMRADINISVREEGASAFGVRTEIKNMNSIKAIRRAIEFETDRHINAIESGNAGILVQETRRWDDNIGQSFAMRQKETAEDYRYFPDADLPPLFVDDEWVSKIRGAIPELASEKRKRYISEFGLPRETAGVLTAEKNIAELFEAIFVALSREEEGISFTAEEAAKESANIVTGDILRLVKENNSDAETFKVDAEKLAVVIKKVKEKRINRAAAREITEAVFKTDVDPESYISGKNILLISDEAVIRETAAKVISANSKSVSDLNAGKEKAYGFLVGQTMRALGGKADPEAVNSILRELLDAGRKQEAEPAKEAGSARIGREEKEKKRGGIYRKQDIVFGNENLSRINGDKNEPSYEEGKKAGREREENIKTSTRYRDMTCGELRPEHIGRTVKLAGWVIAIRDHGGIVFIDLRDQYGVTQISCTDEQIMDIGREYSISIRGKALKREPETVNPNIETGEVEIRAEEIEILGRCRHGLPFEIDISRETKEELRLKYRYLDLRNQKVRDNIIFRAEIIRFIRHEMEGMGFLEIQTPILANSSPEGARDYLVPSRKYKGMFYALPQAPQQFKQLLMVSGFDRYFQIAPCFRDEDARLDRSPGEFYQLDFEMAYATQEDVFTVAEQVLTATFEKFTKKNVSPPPYPRIPYAEAMLKYGTDKPDLRNPLEIIDLTEFFRDVNFEPFKDKTVRAINVPNATGQSKSWFKDMEKYALGIGMKGLGYIGVQDDGTYKGPIDKFLTEEQKQKLKEAAGLRPSDVLYFIGDEAGIAAGFAGQIRTEVARRLNLIDESRFEFCFITDYPMYEKSIESGKIDFTHNPFSMPQGEMESLTNKDPLEILAWQYDIVCNGVELSSGAVRNHRPEIMIKAFEIAGYSEKDVEEKFGALYNAFSYGAPPHAGMAPGIDRIVMLLAGEENIREVIAFPLSSNAQNLMLNAPGEVTEEQLREVHIKIR